MARCLVDKSLMYALREISIKLRYDSLSEHFAVSGILFRAPESKVVCGCAFPKGSNGGCQVSTFISRSEMAKTYAKIYKHGYIPVGMVSISAVRKEEECPYGSYYSDRVKSFDFLRLATVEYQHSSHLIVFDDLSKAYIWKTGEYERMTQSNMKTTKGGAVWISRDNWVSLTLKSMGVKVLP